MPAFVRSRIKSRSNSFSVVEVGQIPRLTPPAEVVAV